MAGDPDFVVMSPDIVALDPESVSVAIIIVVVAVPVPPRHDDGGGISRGSAYISQNQETGK